MRSARRKNWPAWLAWPRWWATATRRWRRRLFWAWFEIEAGVALPAPPELVSVQSLLSGGVPIWADDRFAHSFLEEAQLSPGTQTRPNLKIQEGCGNRCTFCVIPQTRGSSRSLPAASVLKQVEGFVAAGGNELVLSGINLGRWGRDLPPSEGCRGFRWPGWCGRSSTRRRCPVCGSVPSSRWTGTRN